MSSRAKSCRLADPAALEDELPYVWRKAMRGKSLNVEGLAQRCGVENSAIEDFLAGHGNAALLDPIAAILQLNATAIRGLSQYRPQVPHIHAVTRLQLPFEDETVNAWLIREEDHTLLFDTGFERDSVLQLIQPLGIAEMHLFLTHDHRDHVGGIASLRALTKKQQALSYGQELRLGALHIRCIDLSGHCIPTYGYIITGLTRTLCVVGDALFAGSIGGCADAFTYQMALRNLQHHVMTLPDDTILLPGHGPATTVGQEKRHNPFFTQP